MDSVAILVSSFDGYAACWEPFCHGLKKYWPDHFQPVYFVSNEKTPPYGEAIKVGADRGWADNLRQALECIPQEYILYAQEDYWIDQPVNRQAILEYLHILESDKSDYIRLYPAPPPGMAYPADERLGILDPNAEYRASLQMAFWRKSTLLGLLRPGESAWQFEVEGSRRSQQATDRFLCVRKRKDGISYIFTAVVDGYWSPLAYEYARREEIRVHFENLPRKPLARQISDAIRNCVYRYFRNSKRLLKRG